MSHENVLPSAPPEKGGTPACEGLYPALPTEPHNFRLTKICDIQRELESEIKHYCKVRKKYKRAHSIAHGISVATASLSVFLSGSSLTTSLTGVGILVGAPLAGCSAVFGVVSAGSTALSCHLSRKNSKHEKTITLAMSKQNSVSEFVSKVSSDGKISDLEFNLILRELERYNSLKADLRRGDFKTEKKPQNAGDREQIKKELKQEMREKLGSMSLE